MPAHLIVWDEPQLVGVNASALPDKELETIPVCASCGADITTMIFRNDRHCSDLCRKVLAGELTRAQAEASRANGGTHPAGL